MIQRLLFKMAPTLLFAQICMSVKTVCGLADSFTISPHPVSLFHVSLQYFPYVSFGCVGHSLHVPPQDVVHRGEIW
jgi:hypothetical protein